MMASGGEAAGEGELQRFRAIVTRTLGLSFDDARAGTVAEALERLSGGRGAPVARYLARLEQGASAEEVRALARELTVGETYFFRNMNQFRAFTEVTLPERITANTASRKLRIASAGCASGEEAYSLAMIVRTRLPDARWDVSIVGVDVNPAALEKARAARYSSWSLRETPPEMEKKWLKSSGRELSVDETLREMVRFEERNLATDDSALWAPESYDAIFCRNVVMYFTPDIARAVIARLARALVPSGHLFLGHAETLRGLSHDFHLCHTHDTFYYRRRDPRSIEGAAAAPPGGTAEGDAWAPTWVDAVQRSTTRIQELSERSSAAAAPEASAVAPQPMAIEGASLADEARALGVSRAVQLLERERFGEALDLLDGLPGATSHDPDVLLLRAALLTQAGRLDAAERACHELRALDETSAGAHYLLALCRESAGDRGGAAEHHRVAAYLDPEFAMPRLHLGLLARRAGDAPEAQRELRQALDLLSREDAARILLFGGGFTREALSQLCRAELQAAGGAP